MHDIQPPISNDQELAGSRTGLAGIPLAHVQVAASSVPLALPTQVSVGGEASAPHTNRSAQPGLRQPHILRVPAIVRYTTA